MNNQGGTGGSVSNEALARSPTTSLPVFEKRPDQVLFAGVIDRDVAGIPTLEGVARARCGDMLCWRSTYEIWPQPAHQFFARYRPVRDTNDDDARAITAAGHNEWPADGRRVTVPLAPIADDDGNESATTAAGVPPDPATSITVNLRPFLPIPEKSRIAVGRPVGGASHTSLTDAVPNTSAAAAASVGIPVCPVFAVGDQIAFNGSTFVIAHDDLIVWPVVADGFGGCAYDKAPGAAGEPYLIKEGVLAVVYRPVERK
ncbi:hypothetical protein HK405_014936 [Cladochytrium tenue]|nr:hypothetical protein HK405_014936 [Cladochytrium tenue]